ncbi:Ig-like domain-containing protein [Candidatus Uhrbacteria bacterium]|nr:Ig-like domain-containing protein [Candidatus Uhrbacteria bacterium]
MNLPHRSRFLGSLLALLISVGLFVAVPVLAQDVDLESFAEQAGFSTTADITVIIARLVRTAISFVGVVAVVFVVYGGFMYMTAGGNAERAKSAKKILVNAFIGIVLVFSSFAIVQFILNALTEATGASVTSEDGSGSSFSGEGSSSSFYLRSVNTDCASALQNLELQFVFSKKIDEDTVAEGITITKAGASSAVEGTFEVSGKTVTFTPAQACNAPYESSACFDATTDYAIELDSTVLESSTGSSLTCSTSYPCSFDFTTGTGVDLAGPSVSMDAPEDGESLYAGSIELLSAATTDDTGVSTVDFYVIDDDEAIYSSGVDLSTLGELTGGNAENVFTTDTNEEWNTSGYTTNETYSVWATGSDCAGNDDTASAVDIMLRASSCNNEVQDEDLGEEDVDCGGDDTSAYYCGACTGDACTENADCGSGQCVEGVCVETPKIESVTAGDGAVGNLITIAGEGFGDSAGTVTFLGTESDDEVTASAYACNSETQWSDGEIVVQVPSGAVDGPIAVTTADATQDPDRTDDDYGPSIADFDVNLIERPGLCSLDPDSGASATSVDVYGNNFGDAQGTAAFYFTNTEASSYVSWESDALTVGVPNVNAGAYRAQVFTGDYVCVDTLLNATGSTCSSDDDCDADAGESCAQSWCSQTLGYCEFDDDCGEDGGECASIRVGGNKLAFTVDETSSETTPVISSIDSGWSACSGGSDEGERCSEDSDCDSGACEDQATWAPSGQYITIYGTNFGTSTGSVFIENESLGYTALGDSDFPDACGEDFWHDTQITIKVPETYQNDVDIETGTHALSIERADGGESDATDMVILDDTPGPAICDLDPSAGPVGTEVTVYGENFGSAEGEVEFYSELSSSYTLWENDQVSAAVVPEGAATGPVYVIESVNGYPSNSANFEVGDCNEDSSLCEEGESCCSDGSCSTSCEEDEDVEAHYAFKVSTGITPNTPEVVVECDDSIASPSPWEGWSEPETVCVNATVHVDFDMDMDVSTLTAANITVEKCTAEDEDGACETWEAVSASDIETSTTGFTWTPVSDFDADTRHRVTLNGSGEEGAIQADESAGGGFLDGDEAWEFTTSSSTDACEVGGANVSPLTESVAETGDVSYLATLTAADDQCVTLSCSGYTVDWASDFDGAVIDTSRPGEGICTNTVDAQSETDAGDPAIITATVTDAQGDPSGEGELTINFTDPEVDDYFPDCASACVNAKPWAEFNTDMRESTLTTASVTLWACEDSLCAASELTEVSFVSSIDYDDSTQRAEIVFTSGSTMNESAWYRVVLDGDAITAANGNVLSESGSNYGSDANRYFEDDFSWVFKTKDSDVSCGVDSVVVSPPTTTLTAVGDRAEFDATAYGEPDECSTQGEALQSDSFTWSAWGAEDTPNALGDSTGSSSDQDDIVAYMILDGEIAMTNDLPAYCSGSCLNVGASVTTSDGVCGNGSEETYEECDDGNTDDGDGCSSSCLNEGTSACTATVVNGCCGDGSRDWTSSAGGEDCDDGNATSGDGCSTSCLNEGARAVGATCGDATRDWVTETGGEDCDDDNGVSGDGCSSNCLKEGSQAADDVYAICGNGKACTVDANCGEDETCSDLGSCVEPGEDCDDGNATSGDGCSSACLNEGTSVCATSTASDCCGNGTLETGEDCDGGPAGEDGCSSTCLFEGSSYAYATPSFCGDGDTGDGEECEASSSSTLTVGDYSVGQIATGAPTEVDATSGYAISRVSASVEGESDTATLQLECSCTTDASCGEVATLGCGESNCCFTRPGVSEAYPADNTASPGDGYCRNSAIYAVFTGLMDEATFDGNLYLDLESIDGVTVGDADACPEGYTTSSTTVRASSPLARAWQWLKGAVLGVFGLDASASTTFDCFLPVSYETVTDESGTSDTVYLRYSSLLEEDGIYRLVVVGDDTSTDTTFDGVLSQDAAALCLGTDCSSDTYAQSFYVGSEVCDLDSVSVEDEGDVNAAEFESASEEYFSATDEEHSFAATPLTQRSATAEEISPIAGVYEWSWSWTSSVDDESEDDIVGISSGDAADDTQTLYTAAGNDGEETVIATATVTVDEWSTTSTVGDTTTGTLAVAALVCENPWPALDSSLGFPYVEDVTPSYFSFFYCRDAGEDGTDDDLPALEDPIDVTSLASSDIIQELIFQVEDTSDAIGVRVIPNEDYLSPGAWVEAAEFTGTFGETELDGYAAVESGTTLYAAAANQSGTTIYPNIYVVSYNDNAGEDAKDIFSEILENWKFNANDDDVTDVNFCSDGTDYVTTDDGEYLSCDWDGDCAETCEDSVCSLTGEACSTDADCELASGAGVCDAEKAKLTRDMRRLTDLTDLTATLQSYGEQNAHCAVTTDQSCDSDAECPGTEDCLLGFPDVQSGTFVPALTNSAWGSWNSAFANALATTPPTDPTNAFYACDEDGYDAASCWNGEAGTFICPDNSHVYGYQSSGGIAYTLYAQMETSANAAWPYDIDADSTDEVTLVVEYPSGAAPSSTLQDGFTATAQFCDGGTWGDSEICGDGTQGVSEACEIGDTKASPCTDSSGEAGWISSACVSDCSDYQTQTQAETAGAECVPYECGNGVVDSGETCDDGSLNGTYGYCGDDCTGYDFYCGDGYLAGTEQCDCGITGLYDYTDATADDTGSYAYLSTCDVSNGQYSSAIGVSCAYNCTQPGLACGDGVVNGAEACDGDYEEWEGALCSDGVTECTSDSDCDAGACGDGGAVSGTGDVCTDWEDAGETCTQNSQCDSGSCDGGVCGSASDAGDVCMADSDCESESCPDFNYSLYRYRTCESDCTWPSTWTGPVGGEQICGNGTVEGAEACDDGNSSNNDACLNTCTENVCGDDYVESGVESCDDGDDNGEVCEAGYEDTCNYCNAQCQYKTRSGGYCGDEVVNGDEVCDGTYSTAFIWFDSATGDTQGSCETYEDDEEVESGGETYSYTCRWLGVCNGGAEQGDVCTLDYSTYASSGSVEQLAASRAGNVNTCRGDVNDDTDDGECVPPVCAANCGSSCPFSYETTGLLVQSELSGASQTDTVALYSYQNADGNSPDNAVVYVPACTAATKITADVDNDEVVPPDVDIVFVTDLTSSMSYAPGGSSEADPGERKIDYVIDAAKDAVEELFDAYDSYENSTLQIGLVSYTSKYRDDYSFGDAAYNFCNSTSIGVSPDGAWQDQQLVNQEDGESAILDDLSSYADCVCETCLSDGSSSGSTPTYRGVQKAISALEDSEADVKIVVLLTDGDVDWNESFQQTGDADDCAFESKSYQGQEYEGSEACIADIADDLIEDSDILFYTAAVTTSSRRQGYTAHMSSNTCAWDEDEEGISSTDDCSGNYAFAAEDEEGIEEMYDAIVDAILGTSVTFTTTDESGTTYTTTGGVEAGTDVTLPFPDGFICDSSEQTIPLRNSFYGEGTMQFSDLELTYCPYQ